MSLYVREKTNSRSFTDVVSPCKPLPQQYVDSRKAFPLLSALRALVLVRRLPPQSQTVAAEVMAAGQSGGVHQDVVAAVTRELMF